MLKNQTTTINRLISFPSNAKTIIKFVFTLIALLLVFTVLLSTSSCSENTSNAQKGSKENPVKIGVVGASDSHWIAFKKAAEDSGIFIDLKDFSEYTEPNPALAEGQLDINEFQHILFLAKYNTDQNKDLTPISATAVFPISLYGSSQKGIYELDNIQNGDYVAIPNDGTNQSRAILLLESAGLVTLLPDSPAIVTPAQIDTANSKVIVFPVNSSETPATLKDPQIKAAIVNNDFVPNLGETDSSNKLKTESAESVGSKPYINIFVTRSQDKDNEIYKKLAQIFNTDQNVREANINDAGGENNIVFVNDISVSEINDILKNQIEIYKNANAKAKEIEDQQPKMSEN